MTAKIIRIYQDLLPSQNPETYWGARMLTPSEIEELRQEAKRADELGRKAFRHLRLRSRARRSPTFGCRNAD